MAVLSVQICMGLKVLKCWGLHPINELSTLAQVFELFSDQDIFFVDGCSNFVFPADLKDQSFECYIAPAAAGPFQQLSQV